MTKNKKILLSGKALLMLVIMALSQMAFANSDSLTNEKEYCFHENKKYTPGSIINMGGAPKECRDGEYEFKIELASKQKTDRNYYMSSELIDSVLKWRVVIQ